jgi:hypothetical protein
VFSFQVTRLGSIFVMRSLLQASLLLAPALAAAFVVPHTETAQELHNDADALIAGRPPSY